VEQQLELSAERLWSEVSGRLRDSLNEQTYRTWFEEAEGSELTDDAFALSVPNDFTRDWVDGHFLSLIRATVRDVVGDERRVHVVVREPSHAAEPSAPEAAAPAPKLEGLNPSYTFDLFIIGSSNRFAHAAALAVAESPARAYNPLFVYGGTGLGKTHLLQAIAHYVVHHSRDVAVRYVTTETFTNDFINSLRDKRTESFKQRYRTHDVLLVDDIQFLEGRERIQEEFFHTFNALHQAGKQIVISSDRPPGKMVALEDRLRSRFEWGLITDIYPPDLETRIAILRKKIETDGIHVSDLGVLEFIAGRISTNIRELEGAMTRVIAFSSLTGRPMTVELAKDVLQDVFPQGESAEVSIERIQDAVAERFAITKVELCGHRRSHNIVYPRQVAMYLSRELTDASLPKIGKEFGGRDHTTVMHATSKISRLIREDRSVYNLVQELTATVKHGR
jgi:chromosomal replication initiator protein